MPGHIVRSRFFFSLIVVAAALGCANAADPLKNMQAPFDASIQFVSVEGGCWTITPSPPNPQVNYLPLNLPEEFSEDGLEVRVAIRVREDYGSVCMLGPVVEILSISER
jgi:hypothetical protein